MLNPPTFPKTSDNVTVLVKGLEKQIQVLQQKNERLEQINRWLKEQRGSSSQKV